MKNINHWDLERDLVRGGNHMYLEKKNKAWSRFGVGSRLIERDEGKSTHYTAFGVL